MYHESAFSLRQERYKLSDAPATLSAKPTALSAETTEYRTSWWLPRFLDRYFESPRVKAAKGFPLREPGDYAYVLGTHCCRVDPIEAGAEFHEDALSDR